MRWRPVLPMIRSPFSARTSTTYNGHPAIVIRTMQPSASGVEVVVGDRIVPMARRHRDGLFEAFVEADGRSPGDLFYRLRIHEGADVREVIDPYRFGPVLTEFDLHLFAEGTHYRAWEKLGSHRETIGGVTGVHFAVWAPNAQRVSVIGDFNRWDGRVNPMRKLVPAGVWEIFIPELPDGSCYKFEIRTSGGHLLHKTDPCMAATSRFRPTPHRSSSTSDTAGATTTGCATARHSKDGASARCRSTKSHPARGAVFPKRATGS